MRPTFRLVPDFIIPNLENATYGNHLQWEERENGSFKISRIHQSSEHWNEQCIEVYKAWSLRKKLWNAKDSKRITKAKHRLITALRKNAEIEILKKEPTFYRFRLLHRTIPDGVPCYEVSTENLLAPSVTPKNEVGKYFEKLDEYGNLEVENDPPMLRGPRGPPLFNGFELNTNLGYKPMHQPEMLPTSDDVLSDFLPDEGNPEYSHRCCCEILLDNFLCNQKCIWHGMPP